ncbi:hypothetical protein GOP47_0007717 [Adiantum capillus-veneris]|uniref:Uncharacterized protein n=1 Tax=Adiantum capillus-veneris TaxID=13818 RepID=A0A9D4V1E9_ADICA|nr:hypothetical protein GOP47_0007717 [Adiantum capillus-veneris]
MPTLFHAQKKMAPPADEDPGLKTWDEAMEERPTQASALRGEAHDLRWAISAPEAKSHNVIPASALDEATTISPPA